MRLLGVQLTILSESRFILIEKPGPKVEVQWTSPLVNSPNEAITALGDRLTILAGDPSKPAE